MKPYKLVQMLAVVCMVHVGQAAWVGNGHGQVKGAGKVSEQHVGMTAPLSYEELASLTYIREEETRGIVYEAQLPDQEQVDAIVNELVERG